MTAVPLSRPARSSLIRFSRVSLVSALTTLVLLVASELPWPERLVLAISVATVASWALAVADEWLIGAISVGALWIAGAIDGPQIAAAATSDLILLLLAAYVIAFTVKRSGLLVALTVRLFTRPMSFSRLCWRLAVVIIMSAFVIPATSARAAMMLPLHRAISMALPDDVTRRALALLIPTVILLSAGGVLTGAAAHVVALDIISAAGGSAPGYGEWLAIALPVALLTCMAAVWLILNILVGRAGSRRIIMPVDLRPHAVGRSNLAIIAILSATLLLWVASGWHGVPLAAIGAAAAVVILSLDHARQPVSALDVARSVDWKILALLISTILLADALLASGVVARLAETIRRALIEGTGAQHALIVAAVALISMLAHLLIPSRSARAAVLLPTLAVPLAGAGHDLATLSLVIVLGTGFCQLVPYGAKPLLIFSTQAEPGAFREDLHRVGRPLMVIAWAILVGLALTLWPLVGISDAPQGNAAPGSAFSQ